MALFFIAGITAQMMNSNLGLKWFIYMTDQGISFLALHFLIEACLVTARWTWERFHPEYDPCKYSKASSYTASSSTDLADAYFLIGSKTSCDTAVSDLSSAEFFGNSILDAYIHFEHVYDSPRNSSTEL